MITVREALRLPELSEAVVRTGEGGLYRKIRWAHVIDHDDVGHFLEGGELLLTSGQVWPEDKTLEEKLLKGFLRYQISGILFATGRYLKECPPSVLEFGEKYDIPVLEVPFEVQFIKLTRTIHQEIMTRQLQRNKITANIPVELINKLKTASCRNDVYNIISAYLKCPVIVTDPRNKIIDKVVPVIEKQVSIRKIMEELTPLLGNELVNGNEHETDLTETEVRAIFIETKTPLYAIAVPLQIEGNYWGTLWLLNFRERIEEMQKLALEYAAVVLLENHLNYQEAEVSRKQLRLELLELLFEKTETASSIIKDRLHKLGLNQNERWIAGSIISGIAEAPSFLSRDKASLRIECNKWIDQTDMIDGFCEVYEGQLILLMSTNLDFPELKDKLLNLYNHAGKIYIKIVPVFVFGGMKSELLSLVESYKEIESLAPIVQFLDQNGGAYFADQYQRELIIYGGMNPAKARELRSLILPEELLSERGAVLYETLKCLVSSKYSREEAANSLHIHRNTLRYRIERIENILQNSLSDSRCQYWINLAVDLESLAKHTCLPSLRLEGNSIGN